mmetsp:Transcript_4677/g.7956  ORF Transcript_4677/g.7956 Transcript_4677/m.7956 type:complete len:193 (-) Transcript_4677:721-1299(-)|eukprot:CAMPEP_0168620476 /NCGR_PEP_ID=MMETSP0449_2-20121227/7156_1 /TAXON_ID=1082188 /ORGANISM="Strombidium rassoulzadegani, Strain ras09" /LENGTH=192 /DNA_ID=CAMNT_0008661481 /DNA_START=168 /DNA_END=746 /DNA_ORIENTATION=-
MSMLELVQYHGYPISHEFITTEDGYILDLYRINGPRLDQSSTNSGSNKEKQPILLIHGLLQSSLRFILPGPEPSLSKSIAYQLADSGDFDVYLINMRGNIFSRDHESKDPDSSLDYWDFSFEEMGEYDIPAAIQHILAQSKEEGSNFKSLPIVGFSQGTTAILYGMSDQSKARDIYREKVDLAVLLGPAVFL